MVTGKDILHTLVSGRRIMDERLQEYKTATGQEATGSINNYAIVNEACYCLYSLQCDDVYNFGAHVADNSQSVELTAERINGQITIHHLDGEEDVTLYNALINEVIIYALNNDIPIIETGRMRSIVGQVWVKYSLPAALQEVLESKGFTRIENDAAIPEYRLDIHKSDHPLLKYVVPEFSSMRAILKAALVAFDETNAICMFTNDISGGIALRLLKASKFTSFALKWEGDKFVHIDYSSANKLGDVSGQLVTRAVIIALNAHKEVITITLSKDGIDGDIRPYVSKFEGMGATRNEDNHCIDFSLSLL